MVLSLASVTASITQAQDYRSDLLGRTNGLRASLGLGNYRINSALNAAAANHARWMVTTGKISHVQADGVRPRDRAANAGYPSTWVSENIYMGTSASAGSAWQFWVNSPVHYAGLTSPNYSDVGIASVAGNGQRAYVMVFGAPGGSRNVTVSINPASINAINASASNRRDNNAVAAAGAPPFVVGVDAVGNIMHEVREGDTMGDIALTYGYTWDDIPYMLQINDMTWDDIRLIQPGNVLLVPPYSGTYTPTPPTSAEGEGASADDSAAVATEAATTATPDPTGTPAPTATATVDEAALYARAATWTPEPADQITPTTASMIIGSVLRPADVIPNDTAASQTPEQTIAATRVNLQVRAIRHDPPTRIAQQATAASPNEALLPAASSAALTAPPAWLLVAIGVQLSILGFAVYEFIRRSRH